MLSQLFVGVKTPANKHFLSCEAPWMFAAVRLGWCPVAAHGGGFARGFAQAGDLVRAAVLNRKDGP